MLRSQFLCHVLKALFLIKIALKLVIFEKKKCKTFERWGLCPKTPKTAPPLRISGYAPGGEHLEALNVMHFNKVLL